MVGKTSLQRTVDNMKREKLGMLFAGCAFIGMVLAASGVLGGLTLIAAGVAVVSFTMMVAVGMD